MTTNCKRALVALVVIGFAIPAWFLWGPPSVNNIAGTWMIDVDRSLRDLPEVPDEIRQQCPTLDAYRAYLRPKIEGGRFEIRPDGTATFYNGTTTFFGPRGEAATKMTWYRQDTGVFWVGQELLFSFSIGHIFYLKDRRSGTCRFQVDYSEGKAPRSPLYVNRVGS